MDYPALLKTASDQELSDAMETLRHRLNQSINNRQAGTALCFATPLVDVLREIEARRSGTLRK